MFVYYLFGHISEIQICTACVDRMFAVTFAPVNSSFALFTGQTVSFDENRCLQGHCSP